MTKINLTDVPSKITELGNERISLSIERTNIENKIEHTYDIGKIPSAEDYENLLSINGKIATIDSKLSEINRLLKIKEDVEKEICQNINEILTN